MRIFKKKPRILPNVLDLTDKELEIYTYEIMARSHKQMNIVFAHALLLLSLSVAFTWMTPWWTSVMLTGITSLTSFFSCFVFLMPSHFLPFKLTTTPHETLYKWRTRQAPEWLYSSSITLGKFCLLYGDAMYVRNPTGK